MLLPSPPKQTTVGLHHKPGSLLAQGDVHEGHHGLEVRKCETYSTQQFVQPRTGCPPCGFTKAPQSVIRLDLLQREDTLHRVSRTSIWTSLCNSPPALVGKFHSDPKGLRLSRQNLRLQRMYTTGNNGHGFTRAEVHPWVLGVSLDHS